jgi:hypothetical protein
MSQSLPLSSYTGKPKQFVRIRPSAAPEVGKPMTGIVESHPFHKPGTEVVTTPVLSIEGRHAQTRSSVYELLG